MVDRLLRTLSALLGKIKQSCSAYFFASGLGQKKKAEERKQVFLTALFSLTSMTLMGLFGLDALFRGQVMLALIVLLAALVNGLNYLYLRWLGNHQVSCLIIVVLMMGLTLYLICSGGSHHTGPLWFYVMPLLIYYVFGLRRGSSILIGLDAVVFFLLFWPNCPLLLADYPAHFRLRFAGSVLAVSVLAFAYEYTREEGRQELLALSHRLSRISRTDELTGLANRREMTERLLNERARYDRNASPFTLLLGDIDNFKEINDRYGHECGDRVLQRIAILLRQNTQKRDIIARWGGEEFLLLLPETDHTRALVAAERLRKAIKATVFEYETHRVQLTISFGLSQYTGEQELEACIRQADRRLYMAKHQGKDQVVAHEVSLS